MKAIPYGRQLVDSDDIQSVVDALQSAWLTTGPAVRGFEADLANYCGTEFAIALNSGTAALHAAYFAAGVGPDTDVVTSPLTFAATANAAIYLGANVRFSDVEPDTGNLDHQLLGEAVSEKTRVITSVDYSGHACDMEKIVGFAKERNILTVADACHSLGSEYKNKAVGSHADLTALSFHPVKPITCAEGGAVLTNNAELAERVRQFRNHGMQKRQEDLEKHGAWFYSVDSLGFNYRLSDLQAALGASQLKKLDEFTKRRRAIADRYRQALADLPSLRLPTVKKYATPAWHLFVVRTESSPKRRELFEFLHSHKILVQVHYIPVNQLNFYQNNTQLWSGKCPNADRFYETCLSLPIFPDLKEAQQSFVIEKLREWDAKQREER